MALDVVEVSTKNGIRAFNSFPHSIYRNFYQAPAFPSLKQGSPGAADPLFSRVEAQPFLAVKDGRPVGRIAASVHHAAPGGKAGFFGYFESFCNHNVAAALLEAAYWWISARGFSQMIGPVDLTPHERLGLLVEGFEGFHLPGMPYNPPFYASLFEKFGLKTETDLYAYHLNFKGNVPDRLARVAARAGRIDELRIRPVDFCNTACEGEMLSLLHNESMREIWGFVPLSPEEAAAIWNKLKGFYDPELILVAEVSGKPAGLCLALLPLKARSFSIASIRPTARLAVFAVLPQFRSRGIEALLILEFINRAYRKGVSLMEFSLVAGSNTMMNRIIQNFEQVKRNRLYKIYKL